MLLPVNVQVAPPFDVVATSLSVANLALSAIVSAAFAVLTALLAFVEAVLAVLTALVAFVDAVLAILIAEL